MQQPGEDTPLLRQLRVANTRLFKVWYLTRYLQILAGFLALALLCLLGYAAYQWWSNRVVELTGGGRGDRELNYDRPVTGRPWSTHQAHQL